VPKRVALDGDPVELDPLNFVAARRRHLRGTSNIANLSKKREEGENPPLLLPSPAAG